MLEHFKEQIERVEELTEENIAVLVRRNDYFNEPCTPGDKLLNCIVQVDFSDDELDYHLDVITVLASSVDKHMPERFEYIENAKDRSLPSFRLIQEKHDA